MFSFPFMQHAFIGCFMVSLIAGSIGWLMLLRRQAFAAHALPHIGFSGAAASIWLGISPLIGMISSSLIAGCIMAHEGKEHKSTFQPLRRESMTGLVLAASLGFGVWCLHMANSASNQASTLLFGDILGLSRLALITLGAMVAVCAGLLALVWRPLLFSSIAPELAEARGVSLSLYSHIFMALAALATTACSEITGALLSFSLMIGPASAALRLELSPKWGLIFSILTALTLSWGGLILSWYTDAPAAFWIGIGALFTYISASTLQNLKNTLRFKNHAALSLSKK